jgi:drug/metabolite transporter (DMT)-like permease
VVRRIRTAAADTLRSRPLLVAVGAAALAGVGNVTFSMHSGTPLGLAASRYLIGYVLALAWLHGCGARSVRTGRAGLVVAVAGSMSPILLMLSSAHASTASFALVSTLSPAAAVAGGRLISAQRATPRQAALGTAAVLLTAVAVVLNVPDAGAGRFAILIAGGDWLGLTLAAGAALSLATAMLAASTLRRAHPAQLLRNLCAAGFVACLALAAGGVTLHLTRSTLVVALFIASEPGGLAKAAQLWASSRTAPHLVSATTTFAVIPAAVGGMLVLGERISWQAAVAGCAATAAIAALVSARAPTQLQARQDSRS